MTVYQTNNREALRKARDYAQEHINEVFVGRNSITILTDEAKIDLGFITGEIASKPVSA